ncbi:chemotaxis protein CheC, inhibitor of MCP methylation [Clostridium putrefaciens]|uniref:Chemotaxis protein CheC, inhibitor of MCP methylation n=1 Tax=Clostridium putrefaciens TaxID=99675 RepID=A0A381J8H3_9CLOT|nr:chemotaxis protein CheC [Clostridium putrefaciens]SUY47511.1 chemotaxis protein CheC, inhibitor of MCP methylation [Clostridium putrefaciens]
MNYLKLDDIQLDALKEMSNIGSGNAVTSFSQLLNKRIDMTVPDINIVKFEDIFSRIDGENPLVGVVVRVLGDAPGNILFILNNEVALNIIGLLTGTKVDTINDMGYSVLCEVGNIIAGSYMNAIGKLTNLLIIPSVPAVTYDMLGAILSTIFIETGQYDDYVLDIETTFLNNDINNDENNNIGAHFYYIPKPGSLDKMLNALGLI